MHEPHIRSWPSVRAGGQASDGSERMKDSYSGRRLIAMTAAIVAAFVVWSTLPHPKILAQQSEIEPYLSALKSTLARSKAGLTMYTWQQQETVTVKGKTQKQELYEVEVSRDGRIERTPIRLPDDAAPGTTQPGLREWMIQKKTKALDDYAQQIRELAQSYVPPDVQRLEEDLQQGELKLQSGTDPNEIRLTVHDYLKPGDNMILVLNRIGGQLRAIKVLSYLKNREDPVTVSAQFAELADGINYLSNMVANGSRKNVTIAIENLDHRKL